MMSPPVRSDACSVRRKSKRAPPCTGRQRGERTRRSALTSRCAQATASGKPSPSNVIASACAGAGLYLARRSSHACAGLSDSADVAAGTPALFSSAGATGCRPAAGVPSRFSRRFDVSGRVLRSLACRGCSIPMGCELKKSANARSNISRSSMRLQQTARSADATRTRSRTPAISTARTASCISRGPMVK